jgi:hypothetical protein
VNRDILENLV